MSRLPNFFTLAGQSQQTPAPGGQSNFGFGTGVTSQFAAAETGRQGLLLNQERGLRNANFGLQELTQQTNSRFGELGTSQAELMANLLGIKNQFQGQFEGLGEQFGGFQEQFGGLQGSIGGLQGSVGGLQGSFESLLGIRLPSGQSLRELLEQQDSGSGGGSGILG